MELLELGALASERMAMNRPFADRFVEGATAPFQSPDFAERWALVRDATVLDPFRADTIAARLVACAELEGDVIECGAFRGGISLLMGLTIKALGVDKKVLILDSFEGLPAPDPERDHGYAAGEYAETQPALEAKIEALELADVCEIHAGWFEHTLPTACANRKLAFAHIDADLYASTKTCLRTVHRAMVPGGQIVLDDYTDGSRGVMGAVNAFAAGTGETIHLGPAPQATLIKGDVAEPNDPTLIRPSIALAFSAADLARYPLYSEFLEHVRRQHAARLRELDRFIDLCRTGADDDLSSPGHAEWLEANFG